MFSLCVSKKIALVSLCCLTVNVGRAFATESQKKDIGAIEKANNFSLVSRKEFDFDDFDFWAEQCHLLGEEDDYEKTIESCEKAISLKQGKDNTELWFARSYALFQQGKYLESINSYNRVLEAAPRSSASMAYQCAALFRLNRYDDAIDTCEDALQINGNWGKESPTIAWYYRGLSLRAINRLETAFESLIRAVDTDPDNDFAKAGLCGLESDIHAFPSEFLRKNLKERLNNITQQQISAGQVTSTGIYDLFRNDLISNSKYDESRNNYILCSLETAVDLYDKAIDSEPENASLWLEQGLLLEQLGYYEQALTSYERATNLLPNYAIAFAHKCAALVQLNNFEAALEACEVALESNNDWGRQGEKIGSAYAWTQKSAALIGLSEYGDALAAAERAIAIAPDYSVAWNNKAVSQWHLNKLDKNSAYLPGFNPNQSIDRAISLHNSQSGQYEDTATLGEAFELKYYDPPIFFYRSQIIALSNRGRILASRNNFTEAIQAYDDALKLDQEQEKSWGFSIINDRLATNIRINRATASILNAPYTGCVRGQLTKTIELAEEATVIDPELFSAWYTLGLAELYDCRFGDAVDTFEKAIRRSPQDVHAITGLGIAFVRIGQTQKGIETLENALNVDPSHTLAQHCRDSLVLGSEEVNPNLCLAWLP